jgi:hypothetical protein
MVLAIGAVYQFAESKSDIVTLISLSKDTIEHACHTEKAHMPSMQRRNRSAACHLLLWD